MRITLGLGPFSAQVENATLLVAPLGGLTIFEIVFLSLFFPQSASSAFSSSSSSSSSSFCSSSDATSLSALEAELIAAAEKVLGVEWRLHEDIFYNMHKGEKKHRVYNVGAKYIRHRRIVVDWMSEVGEEHKLSPVAIHCAVRHMDRLLGQTDVPKGRLQLVAMACILVAAKHEEAEENIPTMGELNECSNNSFTIQELKDMEISVLRALNWQLTIVSPIHFLHLYLARGIVFESDLFEGGPQNKAATIKYAKKYADFFAELSLQEYTFQQYLPSVMAAAIVAASRRAVKIDPIWNTELEGLTTYAAAHIFKGYRHLWDFYVHSFPASAQNAMHSPKSVTDFEAKGMGQRM